MARNISASGDGVVFSNASQTDSLTTMTLSLWVIRDTGGSGTAYGNLVEKGNAFPTDRFRWQNDNGDAGWGLVFIQRFSTTQGAWSIAYPNTSLHHHLITYDNSSLSNNPVWYVDGASQTVTERLTPAGTIQSDATTVKIGRSWDGKLSEFGMWNRILTSDEIAKLAAGYAPSFIPDGLVLYDDLVGSMNPEIDRVSKTSGVVTGTSKFTHPDQIRYPGESSFKNNLRPSIFVPGIAK